MLIEKSYDYSGTSLRGYIKPTTRRQLEQVFGSPIEYEDGDKVTTEWVFTIEGKIATVYDWKRYEEGAPELDEPYEWHVGGHNSEVVELITQALEGVN